MNTDKLRELALAAINADIKKPRNQHGIWNVYRAEANPAAIIELLDALKEIGEIRSRTFVSLNSVPVSLPENELWIKATDLQAILDKP